MYLDIFKNIYLSWINIKLVFFYDFNMIILKKYILINLQTKNTILKNHSWNKAQKARII